LGGFEDGDYQDDSDDSFDPEHPVFFKNWKWGR
jgi:hypothetical protein